MPRVAHCGSLIGPMDRQLCQTMRSKDCRVGRVAHAVAASGTFSLQDRGKGSAERTFLDAIGASAADLYADSAVAEQHSGVRCSHGVFLQDRCEIAQFRAHTTPSALVIRMYTQPLPWTALAADYEPCTRQEGARAGETELLLLPSLVHATFLGAAPDAPPTRLADALQPTLSQVPGDDHGYVLVRVPIHAPPPLMPADALDMGLDHGVDALAVTLLWPAALCLQPKKRHEASSAPLVPLGEQSVAALLQSARRPPAEPHAPPTPTVELVQGPGAPQADGLEEDIFQGIGQLTEDDFRFFGDPVLPGPDTAQIVQGPGAPFSLDVEQSSAAPSSLDVDEKSESLPSFAHDVELLLPPGPELLVPTPDLALSPERGRRADKYDVHGKFYTPVSRDRLKRPHSSDQDERRTAMRASPRTQAGTPQSIAWSSPSTQRSPSASSSSESDEEDDRPPAVRAAMLRRLHTSTWRPYEGEGVRTSSPASERAVLAYAALGGACKPLSMPPPLAWDALQTPCEAVAVAAPRALVGCQRAIIEVDLAALAQWPTLGLEPADGPKRMHVCAVLVGDVDAEAVHQWMVGLQRAYSRLRLGMLVLSDLFFFRSAQLEHRHGGPAVLLDAFQTATPADARAVLVVHAPDSASERAAEHGYEMWHRAYAVLPLPRAAVQPESLQDPLRLAKQARILYDAAPRANASVRPAVALSPAHYDACRFLRARCALRLAPAGPRDVLQHGAVLHVAYDVCRRTDGASVRVCGIDDRAQRTFMHTWTASGARTDVARIWEVVRSEMRVAPDVAWHVVLCRAGAMPIDEIEAWEHARPSEPAQALLDVIVACVELGAPLLEALPHTDGLWSVHAPVPMAVGDTPALALRTAHVACGARIDEAWTVHLLHVYPADASRQDALDAYLADVVLHLGALQHVTTLRWPECRGTLPWHLAVLSIP